MSQRLKLWCICGLIACGFLLPGLAFGQQVPAPPAAPAFNVEASPAPEPMISRDEKPMTLEELKQMFGAHNVCGVNCGFVGDLPCWKACGDTSARCFSHHCIYMRD